MWMSFCERKFPQSNSSAPWAGGVPGTAGLWGRGSVCGPSRRVPHLLLPLLIWTSAGGITAVSLLWPDQPRLPHRPESHRDKQPLFHDENITVKTMFWFSVRVVRSVLVTKGYSWVLVSWWCTGLLMYLKLVLARKPGQMLRLDTNTKSLFIPLLINN